MNYLKALLLPIFVLILLTAATAALVFLAVQQDFSGGPGQAVGKLIWTTRIPSYTFWLEIIAVSMWAGYRTANVAGVRVAAISSGALIYASFILPSALGAFLSRGASEAREFFDYPPTLFILVIVAGAVGAWVKKLRGVTT